MAQTRQRISLGWVRYIDPDAGTAIVECSFVPKQMPDVLTVQNNSFKATAELIPTGILAKHMLGVLIRSGEPTLGQEVIYYSTERESLK